MISYVGMKDLVEQKLVGFDIADGGLRDI